MLGTGSSVSLSVGVDKLGVGPGSSISVEQDNEKRMIGATLQITFGFGAGLPMNFGTQKSNVTGVIYAKSEYDKIFNTENSLSKNIRKEVDDYNYAQAQIANGGDIPNYAKALWQADGGSVKIGYEKVSENRYEIVFKTSYRQYAQMTNVPANASSDSYQDHIIERTYRTGIILRNDGNGNYISESYNQKSN